MTLTFGDVLLKSSLRSANPAVLSGQVSFHIVVTSVISAPRLSALANHIIAGR